MKKFTTLFLFVSTLSINAFAGIRNRADSLQVFINYTTICSFTECTTIYADVLGGTPPYSYTWETGETGPTLAACPTKITTYKVVAKDSKGLSAEKEVTVQLSPRPNVQVAQQTPACGEPCVALSAMGANTYKWLYADTILTGSEVKICTQKLIVVEVIGTSAEGCSDTTFKNIDPHALPKIAITGKTVLCPGESTTLTVESTDTIVQYLWLGDPLITYGKSKTVTPQKSTVYTVIVTDTSGCINRDTVLVQIISCTGIKPVDDLFNSFVVFPNPVTEQLTIVFSVLQKNTKISITDLLGKEVRTVLFSGKEMSLPRGNLKDGIYLIQVVSENETIQRQKIIVR